MSGNSSGRVPKRAVIGIMMFTACWMSYLARLQMPILAVPMIVTKSVGTTSSGACVQPEEMSFPVNENDQHYFINENSYARSRRQDESNDDETIEKRPIGDLTSGRPFDWTPKIRGQLLAAYALGNVPGNLLGGIIALKFGPRHAIFWTTLVFALTSMISPILANIHWFTLLLSRVLVGLAGGVTFPACHTMVAKWAPPGEKSRFVWSLQGGGFGSIVTYPAIAYIADKFCWEAAWYLPSVVMLIWALIWFYTAYDSPTEHPSISEEEKNYILTAQAGTVRSEKIPLSETPIMAIMTSIPFLSLVILHFGNLFLIFFYQNGMMLYLSKALGYKLTKGGLLASLPWLARIGFGFFFSLAGDYIRKREIVSLTIFRKLATIFSHLIPGICLVVVGYVGCNFVLANVFLFLALGFNGAAIISNLSNNQDLSPNYAGFLYGVMNTVGTTTGMIIPPIIEEIAGKYGHPIDKWQIVFWLGASVCFFSLVIYALGGSGKIQSWNERRQTKV